MVEHLPAEIAEFFGEESLLKIPNGLTPTTILMIGIKFRSNI